MGRALATSKSVAPATDDARIAPPPAIAPFRHAVFRVSLLFIARSSSSSLSLRLAASPCARIPRTRDANASSSRTVSSPAVASKSFRLAAARKPTSRGGDGGGTHLPYIAAFISCASLRARSADRFAPLGV